MSNRYSHSLVAGGTGMLLDASVYVATQSTVMTSIARNKSKLQEVQRKAGNISTQFNNLSLDYTDQSTLLTNLAQAIYQFGPIDLAVLWIHSTAPDAPFKIAELINQSSPNADTYHVLGSAYADPSKLNTHQAKRFYELENISYHEVILGFVFDGRRSRWLSDTEISSGVIEAIENKRERHIVGAVEPWKMRP